MWEQLAAEVPDRDAVVCANTRLTWRDFEARAARLASHLHAAGVRPGDSVAIDLTNRTEYLETFFAALRLGAQPVNVNYRYLADEVHHTLADSGAAVCVHGEAVAPVVAEAAARFPADERPTLLAVGDAYEAALAAASPEGPWRSRPPDGDDVILLYTGGTTGTPKGVRWRNDDLYVALWELGRPGTEPPDPVAAARAGKRTGTALPACPLMHGTGLFMAMTTLAGSAVPVRFPARAAATGSGGSVPGRPSSHSAT